MPSTIQNKWTIKKLLQNSFHHKKDRFENKERDVLRRIAIKKVSEYDITTRKKRTKFIVESYSYPQYYPYYTAKDSRGRSRSFQRTYRHQYSVTIQLDRLSINVPVKLRTGADRAWDFSKAGSSSKSGNRIIEGTNVKNGRNADFFFRLEYLYQHNGILFGRNWTNGPAKKTNPDNIVFLDKHMINVLEILMRKGILKDD